MKNIFIYAVVHKKYKFVVMDLNRKFFVDDNRSCLHADFYTYWKKYLSFVGFKYREFKIVKLTCMECVDL